MESKDQFMWELVVFSIGKHYMGTGHYLCQFYPSLHFVLHAAVVAVVPRKLQRIRMIFIETLGVKTSILPYLT